jgi:tRNA pseudouridine55 synthase
LPVGGSYLQELVKARLERFRGKITQVPPIYSALKVNGLKACEYARAGKELPPESEPREMLVDECTLLEWYDSAQHTFTIPERKVTQAPAVRIRLTISSGFYVRSFAHDLGLACESRLHMAALHRTKQADYTTEILDDASDVVPAVTCNELKAGEASWALKLRPQLLAWAAANPVATAHVNGRSADTKRKVEEERISKPRQRFRGG